MPKRWKCLLAGPPEAGRARSAPRFWSPVPKGGLSRRTPVFHKDLMVDLPGEYHLPAAPHGVPCGG
ncbi:MAG: hypothetical protein ACLRWP_08980 [Bilophila wadsworthia]